jgi:hypothetical protein
MAIRLFPSRDLRSKSLEAGSLEDKALPEAFAVEKEKEEEGEFRRCQGV